MAKHRIKILIILYSTLVLFVILTDCVAKQQKSQAINEAEKFLLALNAKDVNAMLAVSGEPFLFRNQEWESAQDGIGFVLGEAKDKILTDKETLKSFFKELITKVEVEETTAAENPPDRSEFLENQLKGSPKRWLQLELYVFRRGFADTEHIALVGVDPQSRKVVALYLN